MTTRKTPDLSEAVALRYLQQIFKVPVDNCRDFDQAVEVICETCTFVPSAFNTAIFIPERYNVRAAIWELHKKSKLAQTILELCGDFGATCLLLPDESLPGKEGLIMCACSVADKDRVKEDIDRQIHEWLYPVAENIGHPCIMANCIDLGKGDALGIAALQLTSYVA